MHYHIALLSKKVTNYVFIYFLYFLNMSRAWLFVFNTRSSICSKFTFTFTFMHLADAFIQSDLQLHSGYTISLVCVFPGNRTHNLLRCWRNALPLSHTGIRPFTLKSVMNKPQAEGRVNPICTVERRRSSTLFTNKKSTIVSLSKVIFACMVELDHQMSAAKTLVNEMGLDTFVLFNIFNYCRLVAFSEFAFHCFNSFWWILNHIHI